MTPCILAPRKGLFIAGTDTGAGKTTFTRALLRLAWCRGLAPLPVKPVETGVGLDGPADAAALLRASGAALSLNQVCPFAYSLPVAPVTACAAVGEALNLETLAKHCEALLPLQSPLVVESAGGIMSPLTTTQTNLDLAARLRLPVVLVGRNSLGTINHTALALRALGHSYLELAAVILVNTAPEGPDASSNAHNISQLCGVEVGGPIPYCPGADDQQLADALAGSLAPALLQSLIQRLTVDEAG